MFEDDQGRDREPFGRFGAGFLGEVREVCRLHLAKDPATEDAQIEERRGDGGCGDYLLVSYRPGRDAPWITQFPVGACAGRVTDELIDALAAAVPRDAFGRRPELVYRGERVPGELFQRAVAKSVWLRHFDDYQRALWDHARYLRHQTGELGGDPEYPLDLYVDKRWAPLGEQEPAGDQAAAELLRLLDTDHSRFLLVLGDFGTGKTFLMRKLAVVLCERRPDLAPVLVTMRDLEKGRTLDELVVQHMRSKEEDPFHCASFRYLLRQGRVVLLFDGFDELALRGSDRVPQHFRTLREAADGAVTSRHQYFATDQAIRTALGLEVSQLAGSRILRLFPLDKGQRRELAVAAFGRDEARADAFLELLRGIPDLLELATNPRMLTFMAAWLGEGEGQVTERELREAAERSGGMTAGTLYQLLLDKWLEHEECRHTHKGGLPPMSAAQRREAVTSVALWLWRSGDRSVTLDDLGALADAIPDLEPLKFRPGEAAQTVGSGTVLVRQGEGEFGFIHQSVMEWLVARHVARELDARGLDGVDEALADHRITPLTADFLCDLAGARQVAEWACRTVAAGQSAGPAAKANAQCILERRGVEVEAANYAGQDLRGRDFAGQDLMGVNFAGADLPVPYSAGPTSAGQTFGVRSWGRPGSIRPTCPARTSAMPTSRRHGCPARTCLARALMEQASAGLPWLAPRRTPGRCPRPTRSALPFRGCQLRRC